MPLGNVIRFLTGLIMGDPTVKGGIGELQVNFTTWLLLDEKLYHRISNVTLATKDGTTQIDHIIVSPFGVFVIETKNMAGWIFGNEKDAQWTQVLHREKHRFQNPLRQNFKHTQALGESIGIAKTAVHSVIVFVGDSRFKTPMPPNVRQHAGVVHYIKSFTDRVLDDAEVMRIVGEIEKQRLPDSYQTHAQHVRNVRIAAEGKASAKAEADAAAASCMTCPDCGSPLVERTARRGESKGQTFLGCTRFPTCRYTRDR